MTSLKGDEGIIQSIEYKEEREIIIYSPSLSCINRKTDDILLSLIIPAYNEEERLPLMLSHTIQCLVQYRTEIIQLCQQVISLDNINPVGDSIEIVIVNDGSKDDTVSCTQRMVQAMIKKDLATFPGILSIRFINLTHNRGKGAAVQVGMLKSHGNLCLMLDADGATDFATGIMTLLQKMIFMSSSQNLYPTKVGLSVFGSRAHLQENKEGGQHIQRSLVRVILMKAFHFFVKTLCSSKIKDTQCGFKLFTRSAAQTLFQNLHLRRWAFDIELVVMSELLDLPVEEVSVTWHEVEGSKLATSKVALIRASLDMLRDMICVRLCYSLGIWSCPRTDRKGNVA